jgi:hypothetical protein
MPPVVQRHQSTQARSPTSGLAFRYAAVKEAVPVGDALAALADLKAERRTG